MIRFEKVTKSFRIPGGRKTVMRDVTLTIPRGRSLGLLGRNGCGKSTMLRMIAGASAPDSGRIERRAHVSWPLGFSGGFHPALTGAQNARFVARIYGVDTADMIERVEAFAELGRFMQMPVQSYSSGMRARLAFGVSMAVDFDIYLVDEITSVGDAAFRQKCLAAFRAKSDKADIIMVSHAPAIIKEYCDCGLVLEGGRLTYFDDIHNAIVAHNQNMRRPAPAH